LAWATWIPSLNSAEMSTSACFELCASICLSSPGSDLALPRRRCVHSRGRQGPQPRRSLLIHDHNNARNPKTRRETRALWEEFETGLPSKPGTRRERDSSYRLRRAEIIRGSFPELSDATVADLVLRTAYMSRDEILAAVRDYEAGGARPASFFTGKDAPVDPNSGVVVERLFDPHELADRISASGFSVRVAGYWGGAGGNPLVGLANDVLARASRLTIGAAHAFTIAARRL
jgi:hypothetical protein